MMQSTQHSVAGIYRISARGAVSRRLLIVCGFCILLTLAFTVWDLFLVEPVDEATYIEVLVERSLRDTPMGVLLESKGIDEASWYRAARHFAGRADTREKLGRAIESGLGLPSRVDEKSESP